MTTTTTKHTPGLWRIEDGPISHCKPDGVGIFINESTEDEPQYPQMICLVGWGFDEAETLANARLIAAAPELLGCLKALLELDDLNVMEEDVPLSCSHQDLWHNANEAVKAALGGDA